MQNSINNKRNDFVCEAADCNIPATTGFEVRAGKGRTIFLHLCDDCAPKFKKKPQYSESMPSGRDQSLATQNYPPKESDLNDN